MSNTKRWMISTKLKAQNNYKNKIKANELVFVTTVIQANTEQDALQQLKLTLKVLEFEIVTVISTILYSDEAVLNLAPCERYGVEEAINSIEVGLSKVAFGTFITEEHIKQQSRVWFAYTQSQPKFEGPLATDGSELFIDCLLIPASTKEYAQAQINETLLLQGQESISLLLLEEIEQENNADIVNLEKILSQIDNSNLHILIENNIDNALMEIRKIKQVASVCSVIIQQ
ncbi:hypothetical protein [Psychromonas algicola]|uniref:hypothetical protein n=1 Tax=Psychromonas algicola TaxID=2555642 RepID=UPI001068D1DD|nr:hypothetical protein [Psychromonas sp. RZ5]TEW52376.1 hypothetical protein E2R67_03445 [Psychromonas sp. RZ5]